MTLYRWDSIERKFAPTSVHTETTPEGNMNGRVSADKGQRIRAEVATGELFIRVIEGAWRMEIANSELTVRHNEGVIIPSGFSHSAEAIEDSSALQTVDEHDHVGAESLWAV